VRVLRVGVACVEPGDRELRSEVFPLAFKGEDSLLRIVPAILLATMSLLGCTAGSLHKRSDDHGVTVFLDEAVSLQSYFQGNAILIGLVSEVVEGNTVQLVYPSVNHGPSPLYSHRVEVNVVDGVPFRLVDLVQPGRLAVLRATDDRFVWDLIGVVDDARIAPPTDWFADKAFYKIQR
jgi:hypothetical protein